MPNQPSTPITQPPPPLPFVSSQQQPLVDYLRRFSLWVRSNFDTKIDTKTALSGVLLQAYDATPGTTPVVWELRVNTAGTLSTVAVPLGTGLP